MRKSTLMLAVLLSGCGGTSPEIYQLLVDYFTLPNSCYTSMMQPSSVTIVAPPSAMTVQIWEAPENTAFLQVESGERTIDMGAAPNVTVGGIFTGKKLEKGWQFTSDSSSKAAPRMDLIITTTTHAEMTFERGGTTFKGTGALSSSSNCVGSLCPGTNPSCSVGGIVVTGTRVAVQYERAP